VAKVYDFPAESDRRVAMTAADTIKSRSPIFIDGILNTEGASVESYTISAAAAASRITP